MKLASIHFLKLDVGKDDIGYLPQRFQLLMCRYTKVELKYSSEGSSKILLKLDEINIPNVSKCTYPHYFVGYRA